MIPAMIATVAGTAVSVAGQFSAATSAARAQAAQGDREARTAETQARLRERDATLNQRAAIEEEQAMLADVATLQRQFRRLKGEQVAVIGATGLEFEGSPLDVLVETAAEGQREIERAQFASQLRRRGFQEEAEQAEFEAEELRKGGLDALRLSRARQTITRRAGTLGAVATGIRGAAQTAQIALRP